jgi:dipeptidase D
VDFNGGTLRNAIPREAFATVAVPAAKADELKKLSIYLDILKNELSAKEKNLTVVLESVSTDKAR